MTDDLSSLCRQREPDPRLLAATITRLRDHGYLPRRNWRRRAVAAMLVLALGGFFAGRVSARAGVPTTHFDYLLLLQEPPLQYTRAEEGQARVEEYRRWAESLKHDGVSLSGDELGEVRTTVENRNGTILSSRLDAARSGGVAGYFFISARSDAEALAIARRCPHLRHGGVVELRRLEHR